ncbi:AraC family transcriptional regulator [Bradyrhizobium sp. SZCCHNS1054]|uniref:AraC family transcriptional regulator n=1 Tax=Bradyrhizobium sp. SZCCHNS1054 TaxID=3057301 RepID=UPI00291640B1|nr:AraC family transcriptional regulator [Bradyrhizobium sp. SZCCHNS1054]
MRADAGYTKANIPVFLMRSLTATLRDLGLDPNRITIGLGLTLKDFDDPSCRVSFRQGREMIRRALQMGRFCALGIETGSRQTITSIGLVGYAMITSRTIGEAILLGLDLQRETGSMLEFGNHPDPQGVAVTASSRFHDPEILVFLVEEAFASFMRIASGLVGDRFRPRRVDLSYPAPNDVQAYDRIFGCEVRFDQVENAFIYDPGWHDQPLMTSDILAHRQVMEFMAHMRTRSQETAEITESVERILRQNLKDVPTFAYVAKQLGMSERTLRRRITDAGVTFQSVLDRLRKIRALELLANPATSVESIASAVGFTDTHNFRRAFRRWTGKTPTIVRADMSSSWPQETPKLD